MAEATPVAFRASALMILVLLLSSAVALLPRAAASTSNGFDFTGYTGPADDQFPFYSSVPSIPTGWVIATGTTVGLLTNDGTGAWGTANGTSDYVGGCVFGACGADLAASQTIEPFTSALNPLNNNNVPCSYPYASTYLIASSELYTPSATTMNVDMEMDDGAEVYVAPLSSMTWTSVFGSGSWTGGGIRDTTASIGLASGAYLVVIEWINSCAEGAIAVQFSGLPASSTFSPYLYLVPSQGSSGSSANTCETGGYCATSAVVFSAEGLGGGTVTLTSGSSPTLVGETSSSATTTGICSLPVNASQFGCLAGETGQFMVVTGVPYSYTVAFPNGVSVTGTFTVSTPRSIQVVDVELPV